MHTQDHDASHQHPQKQPLAPAEEHSHESETHPHESDHTHEHGHARGLLGWGVKVIPFLHGHSHSETHIDQAMETNARGIWALKVSLAGLFVTALFQVIIVLLIRQVYGEDEGKICKVVKLSRLLPILNLSGLEVNDAYLMFLNKRRIGRNQW